MPEVFIESIQATYAQYHYLIGLQRGGAEGEVTVAVANPLNTLIVDNVSRKLHQPVRVVARLRAAITAAIDVAYEQKNTVIEEVAEELDSQNLDQLVDEPAAATTCWMWSIAAGDPAGQRHPLRALQMRASDIHIHPYETKIQVRYRIDGILYDTLTLNRNVLSLVICASR